MGSTGEIAGIKPPAGAPYSKDVNIMGVQSPQQLTAQLGKSPNLTPAQIQAMLPQLERLAKTPGMSVAGLKSALAPLISGATSTTPGSLNDYLSQGSGSSDFPGPGNTSNGQNNTNPNNLLDWSFLTNLIPLFNLFGNGLNSDTTNNNTTNNLGLSLKLPGAGIYFPRPNAARFGPLPAVPLPDGVIIMDPNLINSIMQLLLTIGSSSLPGATQNQAKLQQQTAQRQLSASDFANNPQAFMARLSNMLGVTGAPGSAGPNSGGPNGAGTNTMAGMLQTLIGKFTQATARTFQTRLAGRTSELASSGLCQAPGIAKEEISDGARPFSAQEQQLGASEASSALSSALNTENRVLQFPFRLGTNAATSFPSFQTL